MKQHLRIAIMVAVATLCIGLIAPGAAHAQTPPASSSTSPSTSDDQNCTNFAALYQQAAPTDGSTPAPGILTNITNFIKTTINTASQDLFQAFTGSSIYTDAVNAAIPLMIVLYGVGFLIGIVQANFMQVLTRLIKVGIIYAIISPDGWDLFNTNVVAFFNNGTDEIIGKVISIGTGAPMGDPSTPGWTPFTQLDGIGKIILSPDFVIGVLGATLNGGPYGMMMGFLLGGAMVGLIKLFVHALKLYATSFVVRSLLIGVAPIFIVFILFERTKQLFSGWVNVMVFLSLQPILFFTFISFFIVMMQTSATSMMGGKELCWTEFKASAGTQNKLSFWRFKDPKTGDISVDEQSWNGPASCLLNGGKTSDGKACPSFPINIVDILSFLILIYVAGKFGDVVDAIASEISNSFVNLDAGAKMSLDQNKSADGSADQQQNAGGGRLPDTKAQVSGRGTPGAK